MLLFVLVSCCKVGGNVSQLKKFGTELPSIALLAADVKKLETCLCFRLQI